MNPFSARDRHALREMCRFLVKPVEIWAFLDQAPVSRELHDVLTYLVQLSGGKLSLKVLDTEYLGEPAPSPRVCFRPFLRIVQGGELLPIEIVGSPTGYQYGAFIELLVAVSQGRYRLSRALENFAKNLKSNVLLEVLVSPTCPYSPHVVRLAQRFALSNPGRIYARSVDLTQVAPIGGPVSVVPHLTVQVYGQICHRHQGLLTAGELVGLIDAGEREARAYVRGSAKH